MKVAGFGSSCAKERKLKHFDWALVFGHVYYLGIMYISVRVSVGSGFLNPKPKTDRITTVQVGSNSGFRF